jgi:probable selenium-dependent hydroxylase accessory protein YqeC
MNLQEALSLGDKGVISLVGAGGKSSLMYSLARELVAAGKRVLTTSTTKIFMPSPAESPVTIISKIPEEIIEKAEILLGENSHLTVGSEHLQSDDKLNGLEPFVIEHILKSDLFDFIIIEADGADRKSLKACAPHEPVVPLFSDYIVALVGLDVVAKPLAEEWVFRPTIFSRITGLKLTESVTESAIASLMLHDMSSITVAGQRSTKIAFLNKADNLKALKAGEQIAAFLQKRGRGIFHRVVIGELRAEPVIQQCRIVQ